eukprot:1185213-Amphidinium_carterae.1
MGANLLTAERGTLGMHETFGLSLTHLSAGLERQCSSTYSAPLGRGPLIVRSPMYPRVKVAKSCQDVPRSILTVGLACWHLSCLLGYHNRTALTDDLPTRAIVVTCCV